jgi:DNA-binding protein HU-beta
LESSRRLIARHVIQIKASKKVRFLPAKALKETIAGARKLGPAPKPAPVVKPVAKKAAKKVAKKAPKKAAKKAKKGKRK